MHTAYAQFSYTATWHAVGDKLQQVCGHSLTPAILPSSLVCVPIIWRQLACQYLPQSPLYTTFCKRQIIPKTL